MLDGAHGQYPVRRPEAGDPEAGEPALGRGQDGFGLEVLGQLAGRVGDGVVAVAAAPGGGGGDVPTIVYGPLGGAADPVHLLDALQRVAPDGRLTRGHNRVGPIEDRVRHVRDFGPGRPGVAYHGVEHLSGDDDGLAQAPAARDHALLLYGDPLGGELDRKVAPGDHYAVGGADDVLDVLYGLVLLDLGDHGRVAAELFYALFDLPHLIPCAHERDGHPIRVELLHPEAQVLDVLRREALDGQGRVREVQALVRGDRSSLEDLADDVAVLDAHHPQTDEAVVYEEPIAGLHVLGEALVGGGEPARVTDEVPRRDDDSVPLHELRAILHVAGPYLGALEVLHDRRVAPQLLRRRAHDLGVLQVHLVVAVAKVEACNVYSDSDQGLDLLFRGGRGP